MVNSLLSALLTRFLAIKICAAAVCIAIAWLRPRLGDGVFGPVERFGERFATRRTLAMLFVAMLAIGLRVSLLKIAPVPVPHVHDEFSYLLAADTFAHGRLTNPTHPMWIFLETFHVNFWPTYMSKYPPAQGAALAIGQILGEAWIGVLLSVAAMYAAVLWMLEGWLPPRWALLGTVLAFAQFGVWNAWTNSYWGGAVPAIGGALVVGALPRIIRARRARDGVILGIGVAILANSRPFEGAMLCLPVAAALVWWIFSEARGEWRIAVTRVLAPIAMVLFLAGAFMAYYNWRGTGNAMLLPYTLNDRTYVSAPTFVWQPLKKQMQYRNAQFEDFYNGWSYEHWEARRFDGSWASAVNIFLDTARIYPGMFVRGELLAVVLLALPWIFRRRRGRFLVGVCAAGFMALCATVWLQDLTLHYAAPFFGATFALATLGVRYLHAWRIRGRRVGIFLARAVVMAVLVVSGIDAVAMVRAYASDQEDYRASFRTPVIEKLRSIPGQHLVIVRYGPDHDVGREWVYNRADIDGAKIVWAREIPGVDMRPLIDYFKGREVWLVDADGTADDRRPGITRCSIPGG
jgi:hypothetical protein